MQKSFAQGLGDLAGDDIRRWRGDGPVRESVADSMAFRARMRRWVKGLMPDWRCRRDAFRARVLRPVLVSDPSSTHAPFRHSRPR